jgi:hypothetical protein
MRIEFQKFIDQKFIYELPNITIKQRATENPKIYEGPGLVEQDERGRLILKMYANSSESVNGLLGEKSEPGKLITDDNYYDVIANDMYGSKWYSKKVRIKKHFGVGKYLIVFAELYQIFSEAKFFERGFSSNLTLYFSKVIKLPIVPFFGLPEAKIKEKYKNVRIYCALSVRDYQIIISEHTNWIEVNISSTTSNLPEHIDLRICEALQFILYTKLNWFFYEKFEGEKNYQKLNNINSNDIIKGLTPPFDLNSTFCDQNWKIFKLYFDFILDYPNPDKYHPISSILNLIIQAEKLPIEARFQTICIGIESILNTEFDLEIDVDSELIENKSKIIKFIDEKVDEGYRERIRSLLAQLSNIRPVDKLYKLANSDIIEERLIKAWEDLRHRIIHGERMQTDKLQDYLDKYYSTLTLLYQLIFLKIGYTGRFTDYSRAHWPPRDFNKILHE